MPPRRGIAQKKKTQNKWRFEDSDGNERSSEYSHSNSISDKSSITDAHEDDLLAVEKDNEDAQGRRSRQDSVQDARQSVSHGELERQLGFKDASHSPLSPKNPGRLVSKEKKRERSTVRSRRSRTSSTGTSSVQKPECASLIHQLQELPPQLRPQRGHQAPSSPQPSPHNTAGKRNRAKKTTANQNSSTTPIAAAPNDDDNIVWEPPQSETMAFIPTGQQRHMRACMVCSIVRTEQQFKQSGCPNCESFLELTGSTEAIQDCTSQVFEGLMTVSDTSKSWVARYQRLEGYVPGVYAVQVEGVLPEEIIVAAENAGVTYVPRDGSENEAFQQRE